MRLWGRKDYIGVNTPGGHVMHWKEEVDGWTDGEMGTTACGRTRVLTVDYRSNYPECAQCHRQTIKAVDA